MLKLIPLLLLVGCAIPKAHSPSDIGQWAKCRPSHIAYWIGQHDYQVQTGWMTSRECISLGEWDWKCSATIAKDTLNACGYTARVLLLKKGEKRHAVAIYTSPKGDRGFIDNHRYGEYGHDDWADIIDRIGGGPWAVY